MTAEPSPDASSLVTTTPEEFKALTQQALAEARSAIDRLKALPPGQDGLGALAVFDSAAALLADAAARASLAHNVHPDPALRQAAEAAEQEIEKLGTSLSLDRAVYDVLRGLPLEGADAGTRRFWDKLLRDFRRGGVDRDEPTRDRVRALNEELVVIGQQFSRNVREDVRSVQVEPSALEGLPQDFVAAHPPGPDGKVTLTTDYPDYVPFMSYSKSAAAREALWRVYRLRGHPENLAVLSRMLRARHELASLLGYPSWAQYVTEDKMIRSADGAQAFIDRITAASEGRASRDYARLLERKRKEEPAAERVDPWDHGYLEDRIRAEAYQFDSQSVRPYLEYRRVKEGILELCGRLFGLGFQAATNAPVWHPDVEAYDVRDGERLIGRFFLDMHPRDGKYKHAAQFTLASGQAGRTLPEAVLVCNFPRPGAEPALLQHSDLETFLHEFGHLLHHILGGHTRWASQSGVRTEWDFVEAPSQLLEEWAWDAKTLAGFAHHHQTGEPLPGELVARMKAADEFGKGLWVRQQMFYAQLSLTYYRTDPDSLDTTAVLKELQERLTPFRYVDETFFHLSFGHLDGYSAIYYTYMWSMVIAKDLFSVFKREGMASLEAAGRYRRAVLEPGGSKDAADLVADFLGREYDFQAYEDWLNAA